MLIWSYSIRTCPNDLAAETRVVFPQHSIYYTDRQKEMQLHMEPFTCQARICLP